MSKLHNVFKTTRLSIWLLLCALILAATSVYAAGDQRPLAAVDILGSPDAAVDGKFAVGTATPGNKTLTVAGVIDFVGAGTVHNYFTQGPGNNMQIRSNVDEYNAVGNSSYAQWNMVMGASLDVFSIRRSPASSTYNEDALFWIEGDTGNIGIAKVDTSNGATIPFTLEARLHVEVDSGNAIRGESTATSGTTYGVYGTLENTSGAGVYGYASASGGLAFGVQGVTDSINAAGVYGLATGTPAGGAVSMGVHGEATSTNGWGVFGHASSTSGDNIGVYGWSESTQGIGVEGGVLTTTGAVVGVYGYSQSPDGIGVYGANFATSDLSIGVYGSTQSTTGRGVYGVAESTSSINYGVYGESYSTFGRGVYGYTGATTGPAYGVYGRSESTEGRGVYGYAVATSGGAHGVYGRSDSTSGYGVYGRNYATTGFTHGVHGENLSTNGVGVYGWSIPSSGGTAGVMGSNSSTEGTGVYGEVMATSGTTLGVQGVSYSTSGIGVGGSVSSTSGTTYGVYGTVESPDGHGVFGRTYSTSGTNYGVYGVSASTSGYDFYAGGVGTDYGPFTGAHEVRLSASFPADIKPGMIVSATGETQIRRAADGSVDLSSTLPTVKLADTPEDNAVLGVLVAEVTLQEDHWYRAGEHERFASVNALGEGRVWVSNINGNIKAGDAITTSVIPGYGQRQTDNRLELFTLGKATDTVDWDSVTETVTFNGQEYKVYLLAVVYTSG